MKKTLSVLIGLVGIIPVLTGYGQMPSADGPLPSFEVATVKPLPDGPPPIPNREGGHAVRLTFTPKMLIMYAYQLPPYSEEQIKGPSWMDDLYQIEGKISDADDTVMQKMPPNEKQERIELMVRSLLMERFKLKIHQEKREQKIYALEVAATGPKLSPAKQDASGRFDVADRGKYYDLTAPKMGLDTLARLLGRQPEVGGLSTINKTGLSGQYDVTLRWTRAGPDTAGADGNGPSFFTAIQEQLGLRLVPTKDLVDFVIVDHIEKPSAN